MLISTKTVYQVPGSVRRGTARSKSNEKKEKRRKATPQIIVSTTNGKRKKKKQDQTTEYRNVQNKYKKGKHTKTHDMQNVPGTQKNTKKRHALVRKKTTHTSSRLHIFASDDTASGVQ